MTPLVLTLFGITLIASPDKYAPQAVTQAEQSLRDAGETLGAASMCKEIDRKRISVLRLKVDALIDQGVDDNRQYYAARNILSKAIDDGKEAIRRRKIDCQRADGDLSNLEKKLGP
jgi:hypothetical protein